MSWLQGDETWKAGDVYRVNDLLDHRNNVATGALEFLVKWEDEETVDPDTGEAVVLRWSRPKWNSWEPATAVPQGMLRGYLGRIARQ